MRHYSGKVFHFFNLTPLFCLFMFTTAPLQAMESNDCLGAISLQLARGMAIPLEHVAQSIKALAAEYVRIYEMTRPMDQSEKGLWMKQPLEKGKTISFRRFSTGSEPAFQAPVPAYLFYDGRNITPQVTRELKTFVALVPLFRVAYESFHYSWVYLTTVDEAFFIYPYLPLKDAVNNLPPTEQDFLQGSGFCRKGFQLDTALSRSRGRRHDGNGFLSDLWPGKAPWGDLQGHYPDAAFLQVAEASRGSIRKSGQLDHGQGRSGHRDQQGNRHERDQHAQHRGRQRRFILPYPSGAQISWKSKSGWLVQRPVQRGRGGGTGLCEKRPECRDPAFGCKGRANDTQGGCGKNFRNRLVVDYD